MPIGSAPATSTWTSATHSSKSPTHRRRAWSWGRSTKARSIPPRCATRTKCIEYPTGHSHQHQRKLEPDYSHHSAHRLAAERHSDVSRLVWARRHESHVLLLTREAEQIDLGCWSDLCYPHS